MAMSIADLLRDWFVAKVKGAGGHGSSELAPGRAKPGRRTSWDSHSIGESAPDGHLGTWGFPGRRYRGGALQSAISKARRAASHRDPGNATVVAVLVEGWTGVDGAV